MNEIIFSNKYDPVWGVLNGEHPEVDTILITGGRGSAKSFFASVFSVEALVSKNWDILYTRYTNVSITDSIKPEVDSKVELLGYQDFTNSTITHIENNAGNRIAFKGIKTGSKQQTANLKSLSGFNCFIVDEAEELPDLETYEKVFLSIRSSTKRNLTILLLNPTHKTHWIYEEFYESRGINGGANTIKDNVCYIHTSYLDVPREYLPDNIIRYYDQMKKRYPRRYQHVVLGEWTDKREGVIFSDWEIGEFEDNGSTIFGQDYGFSIDPTTLVEVSIFKSRKEIYLKEHLYKTGLSTGAIYEANKRIAGKSLIVGDSAEPRLISELKSKGNNIEKAIKGQGSITAGISLMQGYTLIVDPNSVNLIRELNNYAWNDKKKSAPIDEWNHGLDAVRYAVQRYFGKKSSKLLKGFAPTYG